MRPKTWDKDFFFFKSPKSIMSNEHIRKKEPILINLLYIYIYFFFDCANTYLKGLISRTRFLVAQNTIKNETCMR